MRVSAKRNVSNARDDNLGSVSSHAMRTKGAYQYAMKNEGADATRQSEKKLIRPNSIPSTVIIMTTSAINRTIIAARTILLRLYNTYTARNVVKIQAA